MDIAAIANLLGIFGVFIILVAYFLLQIEQLDAHGFIYTFTNFLGAALILFSLFFEWNLSAALMEGSWMLVSAFGVVKWAMKKSR